MGASAQRMQLSLLLLAVVARAGTLKDVEEIPVAQVTELLSERKTSGGSFKVFGFPLTFSAHALYWRRFSVDVPANMSRCPRAGCPVLVDFPGSGGSIYSQRAWTQWYAYQEQVDEPFILVTMEGSPDAIAPKEMILTCTAQDSPEECMKISSGGNSLTSWNVLGWGTLTEPEQDAESSVLQSCFPVATEPKNAYPCYGSQLKDDVQACHKVGEGIQAKWVWRSTKCTSASAANDWDYVKTVLKAVTQGSACNTTAGASWCGDRSRIYLTGQSMGGMSSLQFASPDPESKYFLGDVAPAAVAACSPGGSRNNDLELQGKVPTMLIQGSRDTIAVPLPWAGYTRDIKQQIFQTRQWKNGLEAATGLLQQRANNSLPAEFRAQFSDLDLLLLADVRQGGALLSRYDLVQKQLTELAGLPDKKGRFTAIGSSGYMWESLPTTLQRIVGEEVKMEELSYSTPGAGTSKSEAESIALQCADAAPQVRVCVFRGEHSYPFMPGGSFQHDASKAKAFHDLIWADFFKNGTLHRQVHLI